MEALIFSLILNYCEEYNVNPRVVIAMVQVESKFKQDAVSPGGDLGLLQLRPSSFPKYSKKELLDPRINLKLGIEYISKMKKQCKHKNNLDYLTCYNMGPKKADKVKYPNLFPYVKKVQHNMILLGVN